MTAAKGKLSSLNRGQLRTIATMMGDFLLTLPLKSRQAGHKRCSYTVRDYLRADSPSDPLLRTAFELLIDVFGDLTGQQVAEKWFGDIAFDPMRPLASFGSEEHGELADRKMVELLEELQENGADPAGFTVFIPFTDAQRALVAFGVLDGVTSSGGSQVESALLRDAAKSMLEYAEELESKKAGPT